MDPIDEVVNSIEAQLQETLFELAHALRLQQHARALGHLTDSHLIFSSGIREITNLIAQDQPEDVALEIADERLARANQMLNGMTDIVADYMDSAVDAAARATEAADFSMRLLARGQNYRENPGW